jgi:ribosomal subunit interface protein
VQLEITPRGYEPSKRVRETVEERCEKFGKYASDLQIVRVTLIAERLDLICQINLHAYGKDFHSEAKTADMLASVDKAFSGMEQQLRRHKSRRFEHRTRKDAPGPTSASILESSLYSPPQEADSEEEE